MATTYKGETGAIVDLSAASLHNLASGSFATLTEYDNTNGYLRGDFELLLDTGANPTAGSFFSLWLLISIDGTNYTATNGPPPNLFIGNFVLQAAQDLRYLIRGVDLPLCKFKPYVKNEAGTATTPAGTTHLKLHPTRYQAV